MCDSGHITRILSKAEGVPPLCTWPKMVVRVSMPSFFDTSWTERLGFNFSYEEPLYCMCAGLYWSSAITDLFDVFTCDSFTVAVYRSLCNNDNIQTGAAASLLRWDREILYEQADFCNKFGFSIEDDAGQDIYICQSSAQMLLPSFIWGHLWDEHPVSATGQSCHQSQVTVGKESYTRVQVSCAKLKSMSLKLMFHIINWTFVIKLVHNKQFSYCINYFKTK